jgi:rhodanese-related sulfurtransferase
MGVEELRRELLDPSGRDGSALVLLDVRSAAEYASGHVPGALHVDLGRLSEAVRAGELDVHRGARLATVCETGVRSAQAAVRLARVFGFADVANVRGGTRAWAEAGFGLEGGGGRQ